MFVCGHIERKLGRNATVIPVKYYRRACHFLHVVASGEVICNLLCRRTRIRHQHSRTTDNLIGITKVQTFGSNLKDMICHITECAASEIPPATEVPGSINRIVIAIFSRTYEVVPVKSVRNRVFFFRSRNSLRPNRTVSERVYASYFADFSVPQPINSLTGSCARSSLVTHLGCNFIFLCKHGE